MKTEDKIFFEVRPERNSGTFCKYIAEIGDIEKGGFHTKKEAWDYIMGIIINSTKKITEEYLDFVDKELI